MAKRARGTSRPGQRRPTQKTSARPVSSSSATPATAAVPAGVASTTGDASAVATAPAPASARRTREASGTFSASAAQEYAYVRSDLRRIAKVAAGLFGTMFVLFILIDVTGVIKL